MYAFLSVYNKEGIAEFAQELIKQNWTIIASGGTAKHLKDAGVAVTDLAQLIGAGEMLHHKVVTLDRKFHAMLLSDNSDDELEELRQLGVPRIDLLCNDLYPLHDEIKKPDSTFESVVAKTDIGGPAMIRAAAKGGRIVICDASDRMRVIEWLKAGKPEEKEFMQHLRAKAEFVVSNYGMASAAYHGLYLPPTPSYGKRGSKGGDSSLYEGISGTKFADCLYGENRWQTNAALYISPNTDPLAHDKFQVIEGTDRSFINFTDIDRLLQSATHIAAGFQKNFSEVPAIAIGAKHGNLCGAGVGDDALKKMLSGDPQAISGGWVLVNFEIGKEEAKLLQTYKTEKRILDGVIAPSVTEEAIEILARKSGKCRIVTNPALATDDLAKLDSHIRFRYMRGGFLVQSNYTFIPEVKNKDLLLAWAVGSTSNSNTITLVKDGMMIANATGQQSRVLACKLALLIAETSGHDTKGAAAYSDSFFPFLDGPKVLADAGIKSLFVTSGSIRDEEVFGYLKQQGIEVVSLPDAEGRGFFGH